MINEGWVTSSLVGGLKGIGYAAKGVGYVGKNVAKGAANSAGKATYHIANTKVGGGLLAAATGAYLANRIIKKRKENNTKSNTKSNNIPIQKKKASWQKKKKKKLFNEINRNLVGLPKLTPTIIPNKNITRNPRSVAALPISKKNIKQGAENANINRQVIKGEQHRLGRMAKTGYDKTLGKISTV
jgi:hypothetical protein